MSVAASALGEPVPGIGDDETTPPPPPPPVSWVRTPGWRFLMDSHHARVGFHHVATRGHAGPVRSVRFPVRAPNLDHPCRRAAERATSTAGSGIARSAATRRRLVGPSPEGGRPRGGHDHTLSLAVTVVSGTGHCPGHLPPPCSEVLGRVGSSTTSTTGAPMKTQPENDSSLAAVPILAGLSRRQRSRLQSGSESCSTPPARRWPPRSGCADLHVVLEAAPWSGRRRRQARLERRGLLRRDQPHRRQAPFRDRHRHRAADHPCGPVPVFQSLLDDDPTFAVGSSPFCARDSVRPRPARRVPQLRRPDLLRSAARSSTVNRPRPSCTTPCVTSRCNTWLTVDGYPRRSRRGALGSAAPRRFPPRLRRTGRRASSRPVIHPTVQPHEHEAAHPDAQLTHRLAQRSANHRSTAG